MIPGTILNFVPLLLGLFAVQPQVIEQSVTRLVIQDEVIMRVPVQPRPVAPQIEWIEHKGPKCIPVAEVRRALMSGPQQIDFVFAGRKRVRAEFDEDCPALDFYGGFYLQLQDDRLCARRDAIHSRMGSTCTIERFRRLEAKIDR